MNDTKICTLCRLKKPLDDFPARSGAKDGKRNQCFLCMKIRRNTWRSNNLEDQQMKARKRKTLNKFKQRENDPIRRWVIDAREKTRSRAKNQKLDWNLSITFLLSKACVRCPLLNSALDYNASKKTAALNTPSIDRIDPHGGYTENNVWIVSFRANTIKNNATLEELEILLMALEKKYETM